MSAVADDIEIEEAEQPDGLNDDTRAVIRHAYETISASPGFRSRGSQRRMIAEVAKTLCGESGGERVLAVEGPTGTGKSLGYLLSSIPVGQALEKSVIVATATVALQEQLVDKDLPDLQKQSGLSFTYKLAKGRRRYVCDRNLDRLTGASHKQEALDLGEGHEEAGAWRIKPTDDDVATTVEMRQAREADNWSGDLDEWHAPVRSELMGEITTDKAGCTDRSCPFRSRCAFFQSRADIKQADVVVVNHALLMADLMLGGGVILPNPEDSFYVIDEGHHLPDVAIKQGEARANIVGPTQWLPKISNAVTKAHSQAAKGTNVVNSNDEDKKDDHLAALETVGVALHADAGRLVERLNDLARLLASKHPLLNDPDKPAKGRDKRPPWERPGVAWRFPFGQVPDDLIPAFEEARAVADTVNANVTKAGRAMKQLVKLADGDRAMESALAGVLWFSGRTDALLEALVAMCSGRQVNSDVWPTARWIECIDDGSDFACCSTPTNAAKLLRALLWDQCAGAVVTSATLTALCRFDRFFEQAGLGDNYGTHALKLASPFDYANKAILNIPRDAANPKNAQSHTNDMIARCNAGLIEPDEGTLMLFASWKQLKQVVEGLDKKLTDRVLVQGDAPRHELLDTHKARIAAGEGSILCGVASFSEGIDLPGNECTHVIIAKIPFSVPDSPVDATRSEWLEAKGRNPFIEMSVPEASFRLIQATGRLLRSESDKGQVTILDPRLNDKPYGRMMVKALPPFKVTEIMSASPWL